MRGDSLLVVSLLGILAHEPFLYKNFTPREEIRMAKVLRCRDVGLDCDFEARADSEEGIMQQAAGHAKTTHNLQDIPADIAAAVRAAIRDK